MRLSNRNKSNKYHAVFTSLLILLMGGLIIFTIEQSNVHMFGSESFLFILVPIFLIFLYILRGRQIFEYDSEGEAINFRNTCVIPIIYKEIRDEFPKYKLISYELINAILFRKLYIRINSKKECVLILKYDISYLSMREIKDLKQSLNKIIKANKEAEDKRNT